MTMAAVYQFIQPCCDLGQMTSQAKNNTSKDLKVIFNANQPSNPVHYTASHPVAPVDDVIGRDWNKQWKAVSVMQSSTARKGYSYETIQSSCEEHLARECLELHIIVCPVSPVL